MSRLKNKVCIVTGAAQGIGEGIARLFFAEGAKIALVDKQEKKALSVAQSFSTENKVIAINDPVLVFLRQCCSLMNSINDKLFINYFSS